jgi:hypothetical protein
MNKSKENRVLILINTLDMAIRQESMCMHVASILIIGDGIHSEIQEVKILSIVQFKRSHPHSCMPNHSSPAVSNSDSKVSYMT